MIKYILDTDQIKNIFYYGLNTGIYKVLKDEFVDSRYKDLLKYLEQFKTLDTE